MSFSIEMCAETVINSKEGWRQSRLVYNEMCAETVINSKARLEAVSFSIEMNLPYCVLRQ